jgi:hypothetical protein
MFSFKNLFSHALLALALVSGSVFAGPSYHVSVATNSFSGSGELEFSFNGASSTDLSTALLSNFSGKFGDVTYSESVSGGIDSLVTMSSPQSFLVHAVDFGGVFSFDVAFEGTDVGTDGTGFAVSLYQGGDYLVWNAVQIMMLPGEEPTISAGDIALVTPATPAGEVPEPSTLLSLFTGFGLLGFTLRRRVR